MVAHKLARIHCNSEEIATCYFTGGFGDVATSHDPKPFFLTLKANFDPRFGISQGDLP